MNSLTTTPVLDLHGPQWRDWVLNNLSRRCAPARMFERMVVSVWSFEEAAAALDEGLARLGMDKPWRTPLPDIAATQGECAVDGRRVSVLSRLARPRAVLLDGLLGVDECETLIDYAHSKGLRHSGVVDRETGESVHHQARTSTSVCLRRAETPLIGAIEARLAALTGWPVTHGEGLQVLRYEPGQQYRPHFDWFNPERAGSAAHLKRGGQRVGTTVIYLAPALQGGGTRFPKVGVEVSPRAGGAIFFANIDPSGRPDEMSLHAGTPVLQGTKIVMTYWQRAHPFQ